MPSDVHALSQDILGLIFRILTDNIDTNNWLNPYDHEVDSDLNARRISQVCSRWRGLILDLSYIWGRLVDLSSRRTKRFPSLTWQGEVLRRSARAPLTIRADLSPFLITSTPLLDEFLLQALKSEMGRLQHLAIDFSGYSELEENFHIISSLSEVLKQPAPSLISVSLRSRDYELGTSLALGPQAPLLRAVRYGSLEFGDTDWWLPTVRKLTLETTQTFSSDSRMYIFTLERCFQAIRKTRSMEHLELDSVLPVYGEIQEPPPPLVIPLPHLRTLLLKEDLVSCVAFLRTIRLENSLQRFKIVAQSHVENEEATNQLLGLMIDFLVLVLPLLRQYFNSNKVRYLRFNVYEYSFLEVDADSYRIVLSCMFKGVLCDSVKEVELLDKLANLDLQWVEHLEFDLDIVFTNRMWQDQAALRTLLHSVQSLTTLSITLTCLEGVLSMKEDLRDAFPLLKTLRPHSSQGENFKAVDIIYDFLSWRMERGRRIETLDIGRASSWIRYHGSLVRLLEDKFFGLRVTWLEGYREDTAVTQTLGDHVDPDTSTSLFTVFISE